MSDLLLIEPPDEGAPAPEPSLLLRLASRALNRIPGLGGTEITDRLMLAVHGSMWTFAGYGFSQILKVGSTLILARLLLDPKAFGLFALVNVFLGGLELLSDMGIGLDIVQHPRGEDVGFLDTAFILQMGRSILLCVLAMGLALPFASFYHQPAVRLLATVGALSTGIRGFTNTSVWLMTRRMQMGKLTAVNVIGDSVGLVVSVVWALISPTAWALVIGRVATAVAYVIASHCFADRMPGLRWERRAMHEILLYGTGIFFSSATYFLSTESERLVVGKFASVAELGCFSLALSMAYAPYGVGSRLISNVFFPMMSTAVREHPASVSHRYNKFRVIFLIASVLMAIGFITLSPTAIRLLLRPQYAATTWMLQLLGFRSALELFCSAAGSMVLAAGTARYAAIGNSVKLTYLAIGLTIAFGRFGLRDAIWVLAMAPLVHYMILLWGLTKTVRQVVRAEIGYFAMFASASGLAALGYYLVVR